MLLILSLNLRGLISYRFLIKNRNFIWISIRANRYYDNEGKPKYIVLNCQDITKSIENSQALKERLSFEKAISNISTVLLNNKGNAVNIALKNTLEISKACRIYIFENFLDHEGDLCMRQTHEVCSEGIQPEINNPQLQKVSYRHDGFQRWEKLLSKSKMIMGNICDFPTSEQRILQPQQIKSILAIPIQVNNKWIGFIGFDYTKDEKTWSERDINLLKTASEILGAFYRNKENLLKIEKQNEELQKLNKDKDRFMQILAHDLRSPFNSLIGFTELLKMNLDIYDKEKIRDIVSALSEVSNTTYSLLNNLLLWSRSQLGKLNYEPELISFQQICLEVINELKHSAEQKDIRINCSNSNQIEFQADVNMLKTVLRNLITNAIKFTHKKGEVNIYTEQSENNVTVIISDTGVGISQNDINKLWDYTNLFSKQGTNNEQGTGLGLVLCKDLVEKHGGTIWVESEVGNGSVFKFTISNE
jgi:signal transduction histidine kinase